MTDQNKRLNNPLFTASVTGGTLEDFSQNALLLPARETIPVEPSPLLLQEVKPEELNFVETSLSNFPQPDNSQIYQNPGLPIHPPDNREYQPEVQQQSYNVSSVFSSFPNILKFSGNSQETEQIVPPPAGITDFYAQPTASAPPIPLFNPSQSNVNKELTTPPPTESVNTFRRTGPRRPVYAQIPGLTKSTESVQPFTSTQNPINIEKQTFNPSNNINSAQPNPSFLNPVTATEPLQIFTPPPVQSSPFNPSSFINQQTNLQTPVMAAIPANEIPQATNTINTMNGESTSFSNNPPNQVYRPVYHHWFHKKEIEGRILWQPFSMVDSLALEEAFISNDLDPDKVVPTDGGRFDVNILRRQRIPAYWKGTPNEVRRCSWFHRRNSDGKYEPYEENLATKLEEEYRIAFESNQWHRKVEIPDGDVVVFHAPDVLVIPPIQSPEAWGNAPNQMRPRIVKRGMDEFHIDEGEPAKVDHLLFLVHGIGSVCDLKFRSVEEVVDEFRSISLQLVQTHYKSSFEKGLANRIEVLPISWHEELHSDETGIDKKLKSITLESIPRLRDFTNDTLLDILFYTSPIYCQTIISTVGNQINKVYELFKQRNPSFDGGISLGGHSLGSLILFDLLCHQHPEPPRESPEGDEDTVSPLNSKPPPLQRRMSRRISYMLGTVGGTGQPQINYPHLNFHPKAFFALGSPIGMFVTVRGLDALGEQFALPTCPAFFNIFHPYDPVAYRIESLVNPELSNLKPVLIPHHKGRKRMHLELKETMARVGADLKQRVIDSMKSTWNSVYQLAMFHRQDQPASLEEEVDKAFKEQLMKEEQQNDVQQTIEQQQTDLSLGILNNGRRIDYVLQEAPFEIFNEYIFALTSHVCYWESEDTMLLILKEIYNGMNISADDKIPQQSMTIERPPPSPKSARSFENKPAIIGMDPTAPMQHTTCLAPPPISGFVKKT